MSKRVLIIRLSALGDVAMTVPVVYSLARCHPECEVTMLTRPFFAKIMLNPPENLRVITFDPHKESIWALLRRLRAMHFDYVADMHNVLRSWIITTVLRLQGAHVAMVDKTRSQRNALIRRNNKDLRPQRSFIMRYFDVLQRLGLNTKPRFDSLFSEEDCSIPHTDIEVAPQSVGIAPFARYRTKILPADTMKQLIERLSQLGIQVLLFGARGQEQQLLESWANDNPGVISLPGKVTLDQELALMHKVKLMVTMDSSNMHLASLAGATVVSIWGSTTPQCGFLGYKQSPEMAISTTLPCQPCSIAGIDRCPLGTEQCLRSIRHDDIIQVVTTYLSTH